MISISLIRLYAVDAFKTSISSFFGDDASDFQNWKRTQFKEFLAKKGLNERIFSMSDNPVQAMDDSLIVSKSRLIEPENNNAFSKSEIETQMQRQEEKVNMREAVDAGLVVTESSGTKPDKQNTSSSFRSYYHISVDADTDLVNDEEPYL
ncbi:hypothetical protein Tco_0499857 [Tanacetum coccineum]